MQNTAANGPMFAWQPVAKVVRRFRIAASAYRPPRNDARNRSFLVIARSESSSEAAIRTFATGCQACMEEAKSFNMSPADKRTVRKIIFDHFDYIVEQWEEFEEKRYG